MFTRHDVTEVFLLSKEEWEKAVSTVENIPVETDCRWWLRSQGSVTQATAYVSKDGEINVAGTYIDTRDACVRPAFCIPHLSSNCCKPGDKITVGTQTVCTVISADIALADNIVCKHRFDPDNNDWNASEIKKFINSDEFWKFV